MKNSNHNPTRPYPVGLNCKIKTLDIFSAVETQLLNNYYIKFVEQIRLIFQ